MPPLGMGRDAGAAAMRDRWAGAWALPAAKLPPCRHVFVTMAIDSAASPPSSLLTLLVFITKLPQESSVRLDMGSNHLRVC